MLVEVVAFSLFIDSMLRGRISALFDTADAESLLSTFRRILRGVCEGEVLLDSQMNVAQESECLKHLILTDVTLKGRCFEQLLVAWSMMRPDKFLKVSFSEKDQNEKGRLSTLD